MNLKRTIRDLFYLDDDYDEEISEDEIHQENERIRESENVLINKQESSLNNGILPPIAIEKDNAANVKLHSSSQVKIVVYKPSRFEDARILADYLKDNKPIIVDFSGMLNDIARKTYDFLIGATYVLGGKAERISGNIVLFLPKDVELNYENRFTFN